MQKVMQAQTHEGHLEYTCHHLRTLQKADVFLVNFGAQASTICNPHAQEACPKDSNFHKPTRTREVLKLSHTKEQEGHTPNSTKRGLPDRICNRTEACARIDSKVTMK